MFTPEGIPYYGFRVTFGKAGATHEEIHQLTSTMKLIDNKVDIEMRDEVDSNGRLVRVYGSLGGFK